MDSLAGWTVAVTAERRAAEQAELLQRRGANVILAPAVKAERVDDAVLREATRTLLDSPPDLFVATSAPGIRSWVASAWSWGLGDAVGAMLRQGPVVARSAAVAGALLGEGVVVTWRPESELLRDVLVHLEEEGLAGRRVAVQPHGGDADWFTAALGAAGAEVISVPVYRVSPESAARWERLMEAAAQRQIDAVTFTSAAAVRNLAAAGGQLLTDLDVSGAVAACVGPVTAAAALEEGFPEVMTATPARLGSLVACLGDYLCTKGRTLDLAGVRVRVQGSLLDLDGREVRLTPRERTLLDAMLDSRGAVVSKRSLSRLAWDSVVSEHTVEVTVNRLRRKLGPAALALETTNRRGYRLAVA